MEQGLPIWLETLRAIAPLLAALVAAGVGAWVAHKFGRIQEQIARQQAATAEAAARTAKNKLKLELFERRWAVYKTASETISEVLATSKLMPEIQHAYLKGTIGVRWIFDSEVETYLEKTLWGIMVDYEYACSSLKGAGDREDRQALAAAQNAGYKRLFAQYEEIIRVLDPHLQLEA